MFKFAIEKPVIVAVVMAIVCLFGVLAIYRVPIQMIPDLDLGAPNTYIYFFSHIDSPTTAHNPCLQH